MEYSQADYEHERAICDKAKAYWKANATFSKSGWSSMSAELSAHPDYAVCTNEMRGRVERFEIFRDKPNRIFAYLSHDLKNVNTWTGDNLGTVSMGTPYRSNFGDMRYPFQTVIAGKRYAGTGYGGADMYCRLRAMKG